MFLRVSVSLTSSTCTFRMERASFVISLQNLCALDFFFEFLTSQMDEFFSKSTPNSIQNLFANKKIPQFLVYTGPVFPQKRRGFPPPPLYKLRPCPSYSRRRDRINLVPNLIWYKCSAAT